MMETRRQCSALTSTLSPQHPHAVTLILPLPPSPEILRTVTSCTSTEGQL